VSRIAIRFSNNEKEFVISKPTDSAVGLSNEPPVKIDFAKYRTPELTEAFSDLINVRGIYLSAFIRFACGALLLGALGGLLFWSRTSSVGWWVPITGYSVFAGCVAGALFAIAELIRRSLSNMLEIVEQLLEVTKKIANDIAAVGEGEIEMPAARELVQGVYKEVVLPTVEKVVADQLGPLGTPVLFLYRLTLGRVVKAAINILPDSALEYAEGQTLEQSKEGMLSGMSKIAANEEKIVGALEWSRNKIVNVGGWFRFCLMIPCYIACVVLTALVLIPLFVAWHLTGEVPEPGATTELISNLFSG